MERHSLTRSEAIAWQYFHAMDTEDLYAILGGVPLYEKPIRRKDSLGLRMAYDLSAQAVKKGKARFQEIRGTVKGEICTKWKEFKEEHGGKVKAVEIVAIVYAVVKLAMGPSLEHEVIAVTELICRTCKFSLDGFCEGAT